MRIPTLLLFVACLLPMSVRQAAANEPNKVPDKESGEPSGEHVRFFESRIRPLLAQHCYKCHGPDRKRGGLRLDTRAGVLKGGASGELAIKGVPEKSLIIHAVRHENDIEMPPGKKISKREIDDLTQWVKLGLPYPKERVSVVDGEAIFWAFKPLPAQIEVPAIKQAGWAKSPLDQFILAGLEAKGLQPAPAADRRTLIRRVTFDLIGLPPTPAEVEAFVKDSRPDAYAHVVDRLLASKHYGEHWARHWLDVVRYADSNGLDENIAFGNSWRYRDYVVEAFNEDRPYDQFLLEQLAGDLLPAKDASQRRRQLIATGFLSLGPKVLAEVDEKKMEMDIIDEQIDTFGRAMLGLTLGCARCHDHKFDPITMNDYYGLAGIFSSTKTMEHFRKIARWHENSIATEAEKKQHAEHTARIAAMKEAVKKAEQAAKNDPKQKTELARMQAELKVLQKDLPELPTAMGVTEGKIVDAPVLKRGDHLAPGKPVPRHVPVVLAGKQPLTIPKDSSGRLEMARWLVRPDHPLTARVLVNRIWRWHFGKGIVRTPDNFGRLGEAPDNQALLDWLARTFIADGWSIKAMHRRILLSSTYQMSAVGDPRAESIDPENLLHARANVQRLQAEAFRDSLLLVAGKLDRGMGGSMLHVKNREFLFDHTSKDLTKYDSLRRSLYLPVVRNNVYDVFGLFDFPDPAVPNGNRATTTVAPQALFLMNSDWVAGLCDHLAETLLKQNTTDDAARIQTLYRKAYSRAATAGEIERALTLIRRIDSVLAAQMPEANARRQRAWSALCQTVLSANEFIYIE